MPRDYARNNRRPSRSRPKIENSGRSWRWPLAGILIALFAIAIFYLKQQSAKLAIEQGDEGGSIIQQTMKQNAAPSTTKITNAPTSKKTTPNGTATPQTTETQSPLPQPKFDFYTVLPKGPTTAASNATNPNTTTTAIAATVNAPTAANTAPALTATTPTPKTPTVSTVTTATPADTDEHATSETTSKQPTQKPLAKSAQADASDLISVEIRKLGADKNSKTKLETTPTVKAPPTHYILQLGVFKNYNDVDQLKAQMVLQGFEVTVKSIKKGNDTLYRVFMGPYPTQTAAKKQQHLLEENQIKSKIEKD